MEGRQGELMVKQLRVLYNSIFWIFFLVLGVTAVMVAGASWAQEPMTSPWSV